MFGGVRRLRSIPADMPVGSPSESVAARYGTVIVVTATLPSFARAAL